MKHSSALALSGDNPLDAQRWVDDVLAPCLAGASFSNKKRWLTGEWLEQLVHAWVLYMLPIDHGEPTRIEVSIEQRSGYKPDSALEALAALPTDASHAQRWSLLSQCLPFNFH